MKKIKKFTKKIKETLIYILDGLIHTESSK
jgi:hypothetical protein